MPCAVEPYSTVLEPGSVICGTHFGKPQELRFLAKSATLYMKVDTHPRSRGCRFTGLLCDRSSANEKSKWSFQTRNWICGEEERIVALLFQAWCTDQVLLKLPFLEIPEKGTMCKKWCRCSEYDHACSFDDILQCTETSYQSTARNHMWICFKGPCRSVCFLIPL